MAALVDLFQAVKAAVGTAKPLGLEGLKQIGHTSRSLYRPSPSPGCGRGYSDVRV